MPATTDTRHQALCDRTHDLHAVLQRAFGASYEVSIIARHTATDDGSQDVIVSYEAPRPLVTAIERRMGRVPA